jgi:alanyl-tRNA synthetase
MQQHTGQHVLSAAVARLFDVATVSFHLGSTSSTIDLARELSRKELAAAEAEANEIVWQDRMVSIRYATAEEAAALPLRKESTRDGTLRLIDVEGCDLSACGGTHVARTGAIGLIAIGGWERFRGGQRLEFYCGGRALARFDVLRESVASAVKLLSVLPAEIAGGIERLQVEVKERDRALSALHDELARYRVDELAAAAEVTELGHVLVRSVEGDAGTLKRLAAGLVERPMFVAVLVSTTKPALVVAARADGVVLSCNQVIAKLTSQFGGRGGGKPEFAQAGGLDAPAETILNAAREFLLSSHQ